MPSVLKRISSTFFGAALTRKNSEISNGSNKICLKTEEESKQEKDLNIPKILTQR